MRHRSVCATCISHLLWQGYSRHSLTRKDHSIRKVQSNTKIHTIRHSSISMSTPNLPMGFLPYLLGHSLPYSDPLSRVQRNGLREETHRLPFLVFGPTSAPCAIVNCGGWAGLPNCASGKGRYDCRTATRGRKSSGHRYVAECADRGIRQCHGAARRIRFSHQKFQERYGFIRNRHANRPPPAS